MYRYKIVKRYGHEQGLSATFRQWRAPETHCSFLHGYALAIEVTFAGDDLDHRNWLISFGELKALKQYLQDTFDHKTLVAQDDPALDTFRVLDENKLIQLVVVPHVGCEKFAEMISDWIEMNIIANNQDIMDRGVTLESVKVSEHAGNSAIFYPSR